MDGIPVSDECNPSLQLSVTTTNGPIPDATTTTMRTLLPLLLFTCGTGLMAQKSDRPGGLVDNRDQAEGWYLPVKGLVTLSGVKIKEYRIKLFQDNKEQGEIALDRKGGFNLELDINKVYSLRITKEGCQGKLIWIDTTLPEGLVKYPAYPCVVNLEPVEKFKTSDPFYLDFPSAIVRWNEEKKGFYHSESYLSEIQTKAGLLQAQATP